MLTILQGDALEKLRTLPDESAQCCVTSPPYWGLRDYETATWEGGDLSCLHKPDAEWIKSQINGNSGLAGGFDNQAAAATKRWLNADGSCRCGAKRIDLQIGLESTPEEYCAKIVEVFREVGRVLKKDGTLWLNLGDSYAAGKQGLKPKDLCGIPWRVAFALQTDGWYLRQDIIWAKPNPMPESVTDRCTKAHEYLFLLSKSERYFYDADAIKESCPYNINSHMKSGRNFLGDPREKRRADIIGHTDSPPLERNKRSVWTVPTAPYPEAHFATYPPDLIKPCILAGSRPGDTILDPFAGSGTTGMVAIEFGRKALLIELNAAYIPLIERRCSITPGFAL